MNLKICALGVLILLAIGQEPVAKVAYLLNGKIWVKELPDGVPRQMSEASVNLGSGEFEWSPTHDELAFIDNVGLNIRRFGGVPLKELVFQDGSRSVHSEFRLDEMPCFSADSGS